MFIFSPFFLSNVFFMYPADKQGFSVEYVSLLAVSSLLSPKHPVHTFLPRFTSSFPFHLPYFLFIPHSSMYPFLYNPSIPSSPSHLVTLLLHHWLPSFRVNSWRGNSACCRINHSPAHADTANYLRAMNRSLCVHWNIHMTSKQHTNKQ